MELLRLVGDGKVTLDAIAAVVEADPALAGRMLKLVNSSFAGLSRRTTSISVAVKLLGLRTVKNLALGISLVSSHRQGRCKAFDYDTFWSESFAQAVAARHIAGRLLNLPSEEAFAAGLLAHVGRLALATAYPQEYAQVLSAAANGTENLLLDKERAAFGIDHNDLSAELLNDWQVEPSICVAIRAQASRDASAVATASSESRFATLLHLAGTIASILARPQVRIDMLTALTQEAAQLGIAREACEEAFNSIKKEWQEAGEVFSVSTREVRSLENLEAQATRDAGAKQISLVTAADEANRLRIMVVDDDPAMLRLLARHLTTAGYQVLTATNGREALEIDRTHAAQMIVTDWMMPEMDGIELCRRLRSSENRGFVYIIVLTARSEGSRAVEALDAGADDFLIKPFDRDGLLAHIRAGERIVRLEANLAERSREICLYNTRLAAANEKLRTMATMDDLTGLTNRRQGLEHLNEHWALAIRHGEPLSCIVADIDHFKIFNDTYGHAVGDMVLRDVSAILRSTARTGEAPCRIGGEEFLIICPRSGGEAALQAAERMRLAVAAHTIVSGGQEWRATISMGVAERTAATTSPLDLLKIADDMLYAAKQAGRNCVFFNSSTLGSTQPEQEAIAENTTSSPAPVPDLPGLPISVLVVDDDAQARALSRRLLEREGYVVSEAANGSEALEKVPASAPDVIVLDAKMPIMDGLECTRRLKALAVTQEIPIIMLSAAGQAKDIEAGLEAGVDEYITKPFRRREFTLRVRSMAKLRRGTAELVVTNHKCQEQARTLQILLDLSVDLAASSDLDAILKRVVACAAELTRCRRVSIMIPDASGEQLVIGRSIGIDDRTATTVRIPLGKTIAGQVFLSGEQVVVNRPEDIDPQRHQYDAGFFVSAPLVSKAIRGTTRTVGVLNVTDRHNQRPFEPSELESLDLLCNITAAAVDNFVNRQERDEAQDSIVVALATLAEFRDTDTASHLDRVTRYALILADGLRERQPYAEQITEDFLHSLRRAMPLHDIGKVAVPDHILLKPGKLRLHEMDQMKQHAEDGARTIRTIIKRIPNVSFLQMAERVAGSHHERWDGAGYPQGLAGQAIPICARIAAVADVYDALTTRRVYKEPVPHETAVAILQKEAGSHFDPAIIEVFLARESEFAHVAAESADTSAIHKAAEVLAAK